MGGERFDFSKGRRRFFSLTFGSCFRDEKTWMIKTFFEVWPQGAKDPERSNYCVAFAQCSFTSLVTQKNDEDEMIRIQELQLNNG